MSSKTNFLLLALLLVIMAAFIQGIALFGNKELQMKSKLIKHQAVAITQLPDLALSSQATWLRHRSLAAPFAIFPEDGTLLDYYPASFVYRIAITQTELQGSQP